MKEKEESKERKKRKKEAKDKERRRGGGKGSREGKEEVMKSGGKYPSYINKLFSFLETFPVFLLSLSEQGLLDCCLSLKVTLYSELPMKNLMRPDGMGPSHLSGKESCSRHKLFC